MSTTVLQNLKLKFNLCIEKQKIINFYYGVNELNDIV